MASMKVTAIVVLLALLAACASTGLYNMSDDWCTRHVTASAARCPNNQEALRAADQAAADQNKERVAHNQAQPND